MARRSWIIAVAVFALPLAASIPSVYAARKAKLVGVVLPRDARPGDRVSGSILTYPGAVAGVSGLHVEKTSLELDDDQPRKATLKGIVIDAGVQKRPADSSFIADIPPGAKSIHLTFTRDDQQIAAVDVPVEASTAEPLMCGTADWTYATEPDGSKTKFRTPATYCYAGIEVIAGEFGGDAQQTKVFVGGTEARIVAESPRYCYFLVPRNALPGRNKVTVTEGSHVLSFLVTVPRLDLMQMLEDQGTAVAEAPPATGNAQSSDVPSSALPLGLGIGMGSVGVGSGDDQGSGVEFGVGRRRH